MNNKTIIISPIKFIKLNIFLALSGLTEYKLKQIKLVNPSEHDLILLTAPDGNLFVDMQSYQNWCISNQAHIQIVTPDVKMHHLKPNC